MNYAHVADLYDIAIQVDFDLPFYLEQVQGVYSLNDMKTCNPLRSNL